MTKLVFIAAVVVLVSACTTHVYDDYKSPAEGSGTPAIVSFGLAPDGCLNVYKRDLRGSFLGFLNSWDEEFQTEVCSSDDLYRAIKETLTVHP